MAGTQAPICFTNPPPPTAEPVQPTIPAIPVATNLASAIQAINTIAQIIRSLTNQVPAGPNEIIYDLVSKPSSKKKQANFQEIVTKRTYATTRVTNPQDPKQYVDVKQITGLTFIDKLTGQEITWTQ
jgi:hypothetical protein